MGLNENGLKGEKEEVEGGSTDRVRTQENRGRSEEDTERRIEGRKKEKEEMERKPTEPRMEGERENRE